MGKSNVAGIIAGGVTMVVGLAAAVLCPLAGLALGGYYAATAAAAAGMSTGAVWALGAAGVIGGGLVGRITGTVVGLLSVPAGFLVGGAVGLVSALVGKGIDLLKGPKEERKPEARNYYPASLQNKTTPSSSGKKTPKKDFLDAQRKPSSNDNQQPPKTRPHDGPQL